MAAKAGRRRQAFRNIEPLRQECARDQMAESLPSDGRKSWNRPSDYRYEFVISIALQLVRPPEGLFDCFPIVRVRGRFRRHRAAQDKKLRQR